MSVEETIKAMGYTLEPLVLDNGKFVHAVRTGNLVFTSGQLSQWGDKVWKGKVGADVTLDQAQEAAKICALNALRAIKAAIGSLEQVKRVVKILGMVNVAPGFDATPAVMNGASEFLREVFPGEAGLHARSAVGMVLPLNFAVELEMIVELKVL